MERTNWLKQTHSQPLFPELEWSRPENKAFAGKLLIIGGNKFGLAAPAEAHQEAERAGAGLTRVLLPDAVKTLMLRVQGPTLETEFAPSNQSGSFSQQSLDAWLEMAHWADSVLMPGDFGRNSETAIVLEKFLTKYQGQLTLTRDALDIALNVPTLTLRPNTLVVATIAELQKINASVGATAAITFSMDLIRLVDQLQWLTTQTPLAIMLQHNETLAVAYGGRVSTTPSPGIEDIWRTKTAARAAVWWMQNPQKTLEAITTSLVTN